MLNKIQLSELSKYRLEKARENIQAAEVLLENGLLSESINISYYGIFHSVRALLAFDLFDSKKHTGIISYFNQNYIKTFKIEKEYSSIIMNAFTIRNKSDYDDFYLTTKDEAIEQLDNAVKFNNRIKLHISGV